MAQSDFYDVRLTAAAAKTLGTDAKLRVTTGHFNYTFTPKAATRVLTSEWRKILKKVLIAGAVALEIVTDAAPQKKVKPADAAPAPAAPATEAAPDTSSTKGGN